MADTVKYPDLVVVGAGLFGLTVAAAEPKTVFGGRLGTYKYYDMHQVIDTALTAYEEQVASLLTK